MAARDAYVRQLVQHLERQRTDGALASLATVYFGGGTPARCDLRPLLEALQPLLRPETEFTVELHPLDVAEPLLATLRAGGVNRISMGVQSLDADTLAAMGRGYSVAEAERAFHQVKAYFDNAGIDLIVGYPGAKGVEGWRQLREWGLRHCSVYSLILEPESILGRRAARGELSEPLPDDERVMDEIREAAAILASVGLRRYEISNYAVPGSECRHNLAVWRGEDYWGWGYGAHGRIGLKRTQNDGGPWGQSLNLWGQSPLVVSTVTPEVDEKERKIFSLRTFEGLDASGHPEWIPSLERGVSEGLLRSPASSRDGRYRLTDRGTEVCDSILAELV